MQRRTMAEMMERVTTGLWVTLVGGLAATIVCAVNFKSMRTSGSQGWSDGATAWVGWGFLGGGAVLGLLLLAAMVDVGWFETVSVEGATLVALSAAGAVSGLTSYYSWNHRRHLEETLMEGWTLDVSWGLAVGPWVAGGTAGIAGLLLSIRVVELLGRTHRGRSHGVAHA